MKLDGIPDYHQLDISGEAAVAAQRMENRAAEPASAAMFDALVAPLLDTRKRVLELGCGTAALSRRIVRHAPDAKVFATDKSAGMIAAARRACEASESPVELAPWDVTRDDTPPLADFEAPFDLIISSVMVPYLDDDATGALVKRCASRLGAGGTLVFIEQDLQTDALTFPDYELLARVFTKDQRALKPSIALGLRPLMRAAGLVVAPRETFVWTDETYCPYLRELLDRIARDAHAAERIDGDELTRWHETLEAQLEAGDFFYGLNYHRIMGRKA